jgi:hypothetical protein
MEKEKKEKQNSDNEQPNLSRGFKLSWPRLQIAFCRERPEKPGVWGPENLVLLPYKEHQWNQGVPGQSWTKTLWLDPTQRYGFYARIKGLPNNKNNHKAARITTKIESKNEKHNIPRIYSYETLIKQQLVRTDKTPTEIVWLTTGNRSTLLVTVYADNPNTHERICTVLLECRIRPKVQ